MTGTKMLNPMYSIATDGVSRIDNIEQIDRGYQNLEERLNQIGAKITRS